MFTSYAIHPSYATSEFVTVTSTNTEGKTTISISNSANNTANIVSFVLQITGDGTFKSFKIQNGWSGSKTSPTTLAFSAIEPLAPGKTTSIEITTDQQMSTMTWKTSDGETGQINAQSSNIKTSDTTITTDKTGD